MAIKTYRHGQGGFKDASCIKVTNGSFATAANAPEQSGWNGRDEHLVVGRDNARTAWSMIYFGIDFSDMVKVNSATLYLYYAQGTSQGTPHHWGTLPNTPTKLRRMSKDWNPGPTYQTEGSFHTSLDWHWNNRYNRVNSNFENNPQLFTQGADGELVGVDVTNMVKSWNNEFTNVETNVPNYGFQIAITDDDFFSYDYTLLFYSSNYSGGALSPYLEIDYNADVAPNAPTLLTPTGDTIVNNTSPTLNFTFDDDDEGDHMASWNIEVYADAVTDPTTATADQKFWQSGEQATSGTPVSASVVYGDSTNPITFKSLESGNFYKWRAKTKDSTGKWGPWTSLNRFGVNAVPNAPTISLTPAPLSDVPDDTPVLSVTHSDPDAADTEMYAYRVQVEQETSPGAGDWSTVWDSGDVDTSGSPVSTTNVTTGTLSWGLSSRIRARTKDSYSAWSSYTPWLAFTVHKTADAINPWPDQSEGVGGMPTLLAQRGSTVDTIIAYTIRAFSDDLNTTMWSETRYTTGIASGGESFQKVWAGSSLTAGNAYQWQVKLESTIGGVGDWSDLFRFVVVDASTPSVIAPSGSGNTLTPNVTIDRSGTFDAVQFQLYEGQITAGTVSGASVFHDSGTVTTDIGAGGLGTRYNAVYGGAALSFDTTYSIRARVSADGGSVWSTWSGLSQFKTDSASAPALTSVASDTGNPAWITDSTPDFLITRGGSDTIDQMQVRVFDKNGTTLLWDSGMTDVANSTTATLTYSGPTLIGGTTYKWDARYKDIAGPTGPYAPKKNFRLAGAPRSPSELFPTPGHVWTPADTEVFEGIFDDPDIQDFGDFPTDWEIEVQEIDETPHDIETITSGLVVGLNSIVWPGTAFTSGVEYRWRTRFRDSKSLWGAYSGWQSFKMATPPNGTISTPSNGSTLNSVTPSVTWTYSGGTQERYTITIVETLSDGTPIRTVTRLGPYFGTELTRQLPAGHLKDFKYYDITLTVWNSDNLVDPTPSTVNVQVVLDAPNPVTGLTPTVYSDYSYIKLEWDITSLKAGHTFVAYRVYKKLPNDDLWQFVVDITDRQVLEYDDWYAGNSITYQYRIVAVTTKTGIGIEMESPDDSSGGSFANVLMDDDDWVFVGADRDRDHIYRLTITSESHNRPIQQEVFETLGSSRKVIMRGFVLGHEGSLTTLWLNESVELPSDEQVFINETIVGRRIVDYLTYNAGPHIIKSPFGDVWESQFMTPEYQWLPTGHLEVVLEFIETGRTSEVSI